jgi:zinc protease
MEDLKAYYDRNVSPSVAYFAVVGNISRERAIEALRILEESWGRKDVALPESPSLLAPEKSTVFFVDLPGSEQTVIRVGSPAVPVTDSSYYPATVTNFALNRMLRDELAYQRGYAYPPGVGSTFKGHFRSGTFEAFAQVQSDATLESLKLMLDGMAQWRNDVSPEYFEATKDFLAKSNTVDFEELWYKLSMLEDIALYGLPDDYLHQREDFVKDLTKEEFQELARALVDPDRMIYVVVGDAASQLGHLRELGFGDPVLVALGGG